MPSLHRRILSLFLLILGLSVLAGCSIPGMGGRPGGTRPSGGTTPAAGPTADVPGVVLLLPTQGNFASVSQKIQEGAAIAAKEVRQSGQKLNLKVINSDGPWQQELAQLHPSYAVVGGPLREKVFSQAVTSGIVARRAFFPFMLTMKSGREGVDGWRFFCSLDDQVDAAARCFESLGLTRIGALYPTDTFGNTMTTKLEAKLTQKGMTLEKFSYAPGDPVSLKAAVAGLTKPVQDEVTKKMKPTTTCEAIFVPDSWHNMTLISQALSASGENRLVEVGTLFWAQKLSGAIPDAGKYSLVIFPSTYAREMAPASMPAGGDSWTALGYDFVKFAARLKMTRRLSSDQISFRARKAALMNYAMAPISYNDAGVASQRLFMLQPGIQGPGLLNRSTVISTRDAMKASMTEGAVAGEQYEYPYATDPEQQASSASTPPADANEQPQTYPRISQPSGASSSASSQPVEQAADPAVSAAPVVKPANTSYKLRIPGAK